MDIRILLFILDHDFFHLSVSVSNFEKYIYMYSHLYLTRRGKFSPYTLIRIEPGLSGFVCIYTPRKKTQLHL